ncbi:hypothetical protein NDN08_001436 [Rhodosorus marinus]|uniref:AMMECR1 domain-containing protein n=1 Tax=Rhodosorus marinus TaxID=101924 RepID=A0AAV8UUI2_9RHOD|nr:hypothetical protein NDN08_001436 [Rhodosorus marinus]
MEDLVADREMCMYSFEVLESYLAGEGMPAPSVEIPDTDSCAVFVTWKKRGKGGKKYVLRGCIGNLSPMSLHHALKTYAIAAACKDKRFPPIVTSEMADLQVCVSLLTNFEIASLGVYDWYRGKHGIIINFQAEGKAFSATYLPEICIDQEWSKDDCIRSLIRKAGYSGNISDELLEGIQLTRYQSTKHSIFYSDYAERLFDRHVQSREGAYF